MSLSVSFRRSARAEFIEAAAWYEGERQNLGVEFIAEIERCVTAAAERPMTYSGLQGCSPCRCQAIPVYRVLARKHTVSSFWPVSMAAGSPRFGRTELSEGRR